MAAAPPPSCRVLQLSAVAAVIEAVVGAHSLVTSVTASNVPTVDTHEADPAGHSTDQAALGLKKSQPVTRLLLCSHLTTKIAQKKKRRVEAGLHL